jgi:hypothetical protein
MASRNTHPFGKPAGLSPADLQRHAEPAAYLTRATKAFTGFIREEICTQISAIGLCRRLQGYTVCAEPPDSPASRLFWVLLTLRNRSRSR